MRTTTLRKISFDILGEQADGKAGQLVVIGSAASFVETANLTSKTTFVIELWRPPIYYQRSFLVAHNGAVLPEAMLTTFRVCSSSDKPDGNSFLYGIGTLTPSCGRQSLTGSYELAADAGGVLWKCGKFIALIDPGSSEGFFTLSDVSTDGDDFADAA